MIKQENNKLHAKNLKKINKSEKNIIDQEMDLHAKNLNKINKPEENKYYLPSDTAKIIDHNKIDNFALKLNKTPFYIDEKFKFFAIDKKGNPVIDILPDYSNLDIKAFAEKHEKSIAQPQNDEYGRRHEKQYIPLFFQVSMGPPPRNAPSRSQNL